MWISNEKVVHRALCFGLGGSKRLSRFESSSESCRGRMNSKRRIGNPINSVLNLGVLQAERDRSYWPIPAWMSRPYCDSRNLPIAFIHNVYYCNTSTHRIAERVKRANYWRTLGEAD